MIIRKVQKVSDNNYNSQLAKRELIEKKRRQRIDKRNKRIAFRLVMLAVIVLCAGITAVSVMIIKSSENSANNFVQVTAMPSSDEQTDYMQNQQAAEPAASEAPVQNPAAIAESSGKIIVLDAGHGKDSGSMSSDEKTSEGYEYNEGRGGWGEWRHFKSGTYGTDCGGSGCVETGPSCWYPMGNGDRDTEPEITLNNAMAAKSYLENMGYIVRMTRTSNSQNPSMNKRMSYCFPNNDTSSTPDAALYVCIHSNAGGGRGTSYIALEEPYSQAYIPQNFVSASNSAGAIINDSVAANTSLKNNGAISGMGYLVLFNKAPVPIAYLEIGFFDDSSDLAILRSESDSIGRGIAEGIDSYLKSN